MDSEYVYFHRKCAITGVTQDLGRVRLIDPLVHLVNATEDEIARMEWAWGLGRGDLNYYLTNPPNDMYLRRDLAKMYSKGDFIFLPTHKTYMDAMAFSKRAGFCERDEDDDSPRRPLTALGRVFRYVFIPLTPSGQDIPLKVPMQSQTDEDWNAGIHPDSGEPLEPWVKDHPVVETHCHPVSVCYFARRALDIMPRLPGQDVWPWTSCLFDFEAQWGVGRFGNPVKAPQWFIDAPEGDDESLCESEATGYWPLLDGKFDPLERVPAYASSSGTDDSQSSSRVLEWAKGVPRQGIVRRSARLANKFTIPDFQASPCRR
ncbi:hypothetical protein HDZ31DRAFT_50411, partial [Schizophyllum fasciatum]